MLDNLSFGDLAGYFLMLRERLGESGLAPTPGQFRAGEFTLRQVLDN